MKYRKKQVVIEAFQMTKERRMNNSEWPNWLHEAWNKRAQMNGIWPGNKNNTIIEDGCDLVIGTLEGVQFINWNDWIIRGVKGELYACKPDIFEATYEPAND